MTTRTLTIVVTANDGVDPDDFDDDTATFDLDIIHALNDEHVGSWYPDATITVVTDHGDRTELKG